MPNNVTQAKRNEVLTDFAVRFRPAARRWDRIFRIMPVGDRSGDYAQFDADLYMAPDDLRADGDESKPTDIGWKYVPFQCRSHALKTKITKTMREGASKRQIDVERIKTEAVKEQVDNNIEKAVFGPGGLLRTTANNTYVNNEDWTNQATVSVRTQVNKAKVAIKKASGRDANTIAGTMEVFLWITGTAEYQKQVGFFENVANNSGVPEKIYGLNTVVVDSQVATSNKGQQKIPTSFLMGDDVWIGHVADALPGDEYDDGGQVANEIPGEVLTYGALLQYNEETLSWFEQAIKSDWVEYERTYQLKLVAKECGALLQSVLTA